jgi:hypothetical protein
MLAYFIMTSVQYSTVQYINRVLSFHHASTEVGRLVVTPTATPSPTPHSFSVVPPEESHLSNAPRVLAQAASGSSLLFEAAHPAEDDENEEEDLMLL